MYDGIMAKHEKIELGTVLADPLAVFNHVEKDRTTVSIMRGKEAIAVISPSPVAETLADIHRALYEEPPDSAFFLDVIETRRLLGL
jgi:hypothetical protein